MSTPPGDSKPEAAKSNSMVAATEAKSSVVYAGTEAKHARITGIIGVESFKSIRKTAINNLEFHALNPGPISTALSSATSISATTCSASPTSSNAFKMGDPEKYLKFRKRLLRDKNPNSISPQWR